MVVAMRKNAYLVLCVAMLENLCKVSTFSCSYLLLLTARTLLHFKFFTTVNFLKEIFCHPKCIEVQMSFYYSE